jgi:hypothetical protein
MNSSSFGKEHLFHGRGKKSKQINLVAKRALSGHSNPFTAFPLVADFT